MSTEVRRMDLGERSSSLPHRRPERVNDERLWHLPPLPAQRSRSGHGYRWTARREGRTSGERRAARTARRGAAGSAPAPGLRTARADSSNIPDITTVPSAREVSKRKAAPSVDHTEVVTVAPGKTMSVKRTRSIFRRAGSPSIRCSTRPPATSDSVPRPWLMAPGRPADWPLRRPRGSGCDPPRHVRT